MTSPQPAYEGRYSRTLARPPRRAALRIALIYGTFGALWILFSDVIVNAAFSREVIHDYYIQTIKGWLFVIVTAAMLYPLIRYTVTAVQVSEQARKQTEAQTRQLVEHVRDYAIFTLDTAGNITSWNRGAQQITDWNESEIVGKNHEVFYPKSEVQAGKPKRDLARAAAEGWAEEEAPRIREDGSEFWASAQLTALRDGENSISGYLAVIRDVTERRRAQEALRQSHATLSGMIDAMPLPVIAIDKQRKVIGWNPAAAEVFGWTSDEVIGKPLPTVPEDQGERFKKLANDQWSGNQAHGLEVIRQTKTGRRVYMSLWTAPLLDPNGQIAGSMGIFADLTERKLAEQQVRQLNETLENRVKERTARLEEANEELQAFSYTVSHDLRIPLRSLQAMSRDLIEHHGQTLDEEGTSEALRIVGAAARMERQIEDLLEYSRASRSELPIEPVSLILIVHELLGRLERDPQFKNAQVAIQEPLGWVKGHRLTLQQVILNVLTNAITFVAPGVRPYVRISAQERGDIVRLCISDNGIGIRDEDRDRVFQLFERLPAAERYPGIGVGLAVVRRGVERMGGTISIEPNPAGGTMLCIDLPKVVAKT